MSFSARTSANQVQDTMDSKMEKRRRGVYGPAAGSHYIIYIDDFNMPQKEEYGAQPPLEMIRQALSQGGWYDRKTLQYKNIIDRTFIVVTMGTPGGGKNIISERVKRWFNLIGYVEMDDSSKEAIYQTILSNHFSENFADELGRLVPAIVTATLQMYLTISKELLPTPAKPHYTFNLRDFGKVFQGIMMCPPKQLETSKICTFVDP